MKIFPVRKLDLAGSLVSGKGYLNTNPHQCSMAIHFLALFYPSLGMQIHVESCLADPLRIIALHSQQCVIEDINPADGADANVLTGPLWRDNIPFTNSIMCLANIDYV